MRLSTLLVIVLIVVVIAAASYFSRTSARKQVTVGVEDAKAEARRWIERLGGQVLSLDGKDNAAARQALADASERYTAAGAQIEQATTARQAQLAQHTAYEGLYYVRAARTTLGLDPGPDVPPIPGQAQAGAVTEDKKVEVAGRGYEASPNPSDGTPHYYPGGLVAGRPVPRGWYSEPWWRSALTAGVWGAGSYLVASSLFAGMAGIGGWGGYYGDGYNEGIDGGDVSGDGSDGNGGPDGADGGYDNGGGDSGDGGDWGGADGGGGDWGGGGGDWGGGGGFDGGGFDGGGFDGGFEI
ncbi:MAG: hypothetical protein M3Z00_07980 [Actinomycetota bacterium]|nr:hypothetical protein [Actinomycetota bacterium]